MFALLKSDLMLKFMGGFVLGTVGVITLQPAEAQQRAVSVQPVKMIDATL